MVDSKPWSIVAIILAAGLSRRMGRPKQLLELDGVPLIAHVARRALQSSVDRVLIVLGAEADRVRGALDGLPVGFVENPLYATGQASSLRAGLAAVRECADAVVILLGDQPGIDPLVIDRVIDARRRGATLAMARYGEDRGHPVLFGCELFDELDTVKGDEGGRKILRSHHAELVLVPATTDHVPSDVDTEEAWRQLKQTGL